jgi:hypothetical protein
MEIIPTTKNNSLWALTQVFNFLSNGLPMPIRKSLIIIFAAVVLVFSCHKDKLNQPALGQLYEATLANKQGVERLLIGAYAFLDGFSGEGQVWTGGFGSGASNWLYGSICGSEAYKGSEQGDQGAMLNLEQFTAIATNPFLHEKWSVVYGGVQRANDVLRVMKKANDINEQEAKRIAAEARFLRANYHFEAVKMWNKVPFVDESITYDAGNYYLSNDTLIWPAIELDFAYAVDNLPRIQIAVGRANKYAAEAFLAKVYLFQKKYAAAKPLLEDLIANGVTAGGLKYKLVNYADNFNPATKNSAEAVFSVQMSVNDGGEGFNGNFGDVLNFPHLGGAGGCCGFFQPSQYLVNHFKTDAVTGLPDLQHFNDIDVKNDQGKESSELFIPYAGTLDPRLDWTVGRRGIPYLDWGDHPGKAWIRDQHFFGPYSPKKNAYYKSQEGQYTQAGSWTKGFTANNLNLIRFAEVLLWAAETEAELGNLDKAREYINQVRRRAADTSGWVKKTDGTPAANYKIGEYTTPWTDPAFALKAIRFERTLELAMEGHRFFDLVRWGIADTEINGYLQKEKKLRTYLSWVVFKKGCNEYFPIPQIEIDKSVGNGLTPVMKQNPCY